MASLKDIQDQINNNTFDPSKLNARQRQAVDEAIKRGLITGPSMSELQSQRAGAAKDVATIEEAVKNPIGVRLQQTGSSLDGRSEAVLAGDLIGSITPYVSMRKKIFSAAKSKVPGDKSTGLFARTKMFSNFADKLTTRLPGRFKLLGGLTKLLAKVADPTVGRVLASPLGRAEVYSVLGGTAGAGAGSVTYDMLNETVGVAAMDAIASDMENMSPKEVNTDMMANAADSMFTALAWNAGAATLTPVITKGLGKVGRLMIGAKSKDAKELVNIARERGLPLPMVMTAQEGTGLLGGFASKYFKVLGIMPFINGIGREALQGAEQKAGKNYLNNDVLRFGPLVKTGMLSATIWKQADAAFKQNSNLINSSYKAFDTLADTIGNPKVIPTGHVKKMAGDYVDELAMQFPGLRGYAQDKLGDLPLKDLAKLQGTGDPLALFFRYMNAVDDFVTPKQYKGMITTLNRAIQQTSYENIRPQLWSIREALENDLNSFGANITKETFLKDDTVKAAYETLSKTNKAAADANINLMIKESEGLKNKLYNANDTFSTLMNFYQDANITKVFREYNATTFTNKALAGIGGMQKKKAQRFFNDLANDVFTRGDTDAILQFKQLLGASKIASRKDPTKSIGVTKGGGEALFDAAKARWMFNTFIKSFDSSTTRAGRSMLDEIMQESTVRAGINGTVDVMESMVQKGTGVDQTIDFSIDKVKTGNNIFDATKIRFSPKDTSSFNINKFMRNLGIDDITDDVGNSKMKAILGGPQQAKEFERFLTYMKAVSDTPIADTSTFMQRRLQLGGLNSFTGALVLGGSAAVNPFAPALFILLGRRAGQILTDPIAMRAFNDALNPEEQIRLLMGKKVGDGVPGVLGIGRRYFKGRDIQTAANILKTPSVVGRLGLTQKREAFARLVNYLNESDADVPRVDPKTVTPEEITERMGQLDAKVPAPNYNEDTIPKKNFEIMFAQDYSGSSGDLQTDTNAVTMLSTATQNEAMVDAEEAPVEAEEKTSIMADLQLEDPVARPPVAPVPPATGKVDPQQFAAVFPEDNLGQAIAQRGVRRG
jgi:hypothetical protein